MVNWYWSLYAWDFQNKKIMVVDPLDMNLGVDALNKKHHQTLELMHRSMCLFMESKNDTGGMKVEEWEKEYIKIPGGSCDV